MLTVEGPKVLEFNVRFGDPETQVVLPLLESDLSEVLEATARGELDPSSVRWRAKTALCVVLASGGYPGGYEKGKVIQGMEAPPPGVTVFHAGTQLEEGAIVSSGGRVLGVTAVADSFDAARERAYRAVSKISFEGMTYRKDIGARAVAMIGNAR